MVTSVRVDRLNPFGTNRVGLGGPGFPLSIRVELRESVWTAQGTALRAIDFVDLAGDLLGPVSVVSNIGQTVFLDESGDPLRARQIAVEQGVSAQVHDLAWATLTGSPRYGDVLAVQSSDLAQFFTGWSLYDVDLLDAPTNPDLEQCEEVMLAINTRAPSDPPLLCGLDMPSVYFAGHDDCYFYAESRDERLPWRIMNRLLAVLAGATRLDDATDVIVSEPDEGFASQLFDRSDAWVGSARMADAQDVIVELTAGDWRLGQPIPHDPMLLARLATAEGTWSLQEPA